MNLEASFARCCALACVSLFTIAAAFVLADAQVMQKLIALGAEPSGNTPE